MSITGQILMIYQSGTNKFIIIPCWSLKYHLCLADTFLVLSDYRIFFISVLLVVFRRVAQWSAKVSICPSRIILAPLCTLVRIFHAAFEWCCTYFLFLLPLSSIWCLAFIYSKRGDVCVSSNLRLSRNFQYVTIYPLCSSRGGSTNISRLVGVVLRLFQQQVYIQPVQYQVCQIYSRDIWLMIHL